MNSQDAEEEDEQSCREVERKRSNTARMTANININITNKVGHKQKLRQIQRQRVRW